MTANSIVEHLDVLEDVELCGVPGEVDLVVNQLRLQGPEEAFERRVIPTLSGQSGPR